MAFNAKNLSYGMMIQLNSKLARMDILTYKCANTDSNEPTFLRKLKAQYGEGETARHERPIARPRKQLIEGEGDDDQPTYVVEGTSDTVSKEEYEALVRDPSVSDKEPLNGESSSLSKTKEEGKPTEPDARVIDSDPKQEKSAAIGSSSKKRLVKAVGGEEQGDDVDTARPGEAQKKNKLKKAKKIKLSFDEEPSPG